MFVCFLVTRASVNPKIFQMGVSPEAHTGKRIIRRQGKPATNQKDLLPANSLEFPDN